MALAPETRKLTYEDYCKLPDEPRVELIEGELFVSPSPNLEHQQIVGKIFRALSDWVEQHALGTVFIAPTDVVFLKHNVVQPDVLFISNKNEEKLSVNNIQGAPDLVVEVVSPNHTSRDTLLKKALYEKYGVQEYWIVFPEEKCIAVYQLVSKHLEEVATYSINDHLKSPLFVDLSLPLISVFK